MIKKEEQVMKRQYFIPTVQSEVLYCSTMIMGVGSGGGDQNSGMGTSNDPKDQGGARAPRRSVF